MKRLIPFIVFSSFLVASPVWAEGHENSPSASYQVAALSTPPPLTSTPAQHRFEMDEILKNLPIVPVYIEGPMKSRISQEEQQKLIVKLGVLDPPIKAVIVTQDFLRQESKLIADFARDLHQTLNLGDGILVVVTEQGVAATGGRIAPEKTDQIVNGSLSHFSNSYTDGLIYLSDQLNEAGNNRMFIATLVFIPLGLAGLGFLLYSTYKKRKAIARERDAVNLILSRYLTQMKPLNENMFYFQEDPRAKDGVKRFTEAKNIYDTVSRDAPYSTDIEELHKMKGALRSGLDKLREAETIFKLRLEGGDKQKPQTANNLQANHDASAQLTQTTEMTSEKPITEPLAAEGTPAPLDAADLTAQLESKHSS